MGILFLLLAVAALVGALRISSVYPLQSRVQRNQIICDGGISHTTTGNTNSGSATVASVASFTGIGYGSKVTGAGIPANTTVIALDHTAGTITLSANATATATGITLTITGANPGSLDGKSLRFFSAPYSGSVSTQLSDLTAIECTFDTYVATTLAMTTGYVGPASTPTAESQLVSFTMPSSPVTPNTVYGGWVDDGTNVLIVFTFDNPVAMASFGNQLAGVLQDGYPPGPTWKQLVP